MTAPTLPLPALRAAFGERLREGVPLANLCTARVGGPAVAAEIHSAEQLAAAVQTCWKLDVPFRVLGSGSNVLFSDDGVAELVLINRARAVQLDLRAEPPTIWAESGANFSALARQAAQHGLSGLEWATSIPGTLGGAVYGNAGAYKSEMSANLALAEILHRDLGRARWNLNQMQYQYRSSRLKREGIPAVILIAALHLAHGSREAIQAQMEANIAHRKRTQPPGASMGSMFKNPPGDYAGRLIEAAGLKGYRIGGAQISPLHANFFVNDAGARSQDIYQLIRAAQRQVAQQFGVTLELEIELAGSFIDDGEPNEGNPAA